jgi:hypothetical protein
LSISFIHPLLSTTEIAERCGSWAKALHYKEMEFKGVSGVLESTTSIQASQSGITQRSQGGGSQPHTQNAIPPFLQTHVHHLHDKDKEYDSRVCEALISINQQLDLPEAAMGMIVVAPPKTMLVRFILL